MKTSNLLTKVFMSAVMFGTITGCGSSNPSANQTDQTDQTSETTSEKETKEKDFVSADYEEMGSGTFGVVNESGSTLEGQDIVIYVEDPDNEMISIGYEGWDMDGSALSYIYIDGMLNTKEQVSDTQGTLTLTGDELEPGEHTVELVQYLDDDTANEVVTYKTAAYTCKQK